MTRPAGLARAAVACALALCAVLTVSGILLMPDFSGGHPERLASIAGAPTAATASAILFTLSQVPFVLGLAGVAHLTRGRSLILSAFAAGFVILGGFGHMAYGGVQVLMIEMAEDPDNVDLYAEILSGAEQGSGLIYMAMGLVGTILGVLLTGIAVWRAKVGPRWLGPVLIAFVIVEFGAAGLSDWAGYAAGLLYLVAFLALAVSVGRSPITDWATAAEASREPAAVV